MSLPCPVPKSKKQTKASPHVQWLGASNELRQETAILDLCISRNGRFAATVDDQHVIRVFDLAAGTCRGFVKIPAKSLKQFEQVSGVSVADVNKFLKQFQQTKKMMKHVARFAGKGLPPGVG